MNGRKKCSKQTISQHDSFIHPGCQGDTYCRISSDDLPNSDSLFLSSWVKPTDECYLNNIQESTFNEPQLGNCNEICISGVHTNHMQSFPTSMMSITKANGTSNAVSKHAAGIHPKCHRLPAVSSAAQIIDQETPSNDLDIALTKTQVIYAEPNHGHFNHNSDGSNYLLINESICDRSNCLSCNHRVEKSQQPDFLKTTSHTSVLNAASNCTYSSHSSSDSEDSHTNDPLLAKLHISEEDLITEDDDIKQPSSPAPKNYPNVINPYCNVPRQNYNIATASNRLVESPVSSKASAPNNQLLATDVGKSASQLLTNGYNPSIEDLNIAQVTRNNSVPNFVF